MKADGKSKVKTIIVVVILVLVGILGVLGAGTVKTYLSGAVAGVEPVGVSVAVQERQATITWTSEKASMGVVEYGTSPASLLLRAPETDSLETHSLVLTPLKPGLSYYFRIRVGDDVFDNNGIPYSFKTKAEGTDVGGEAVMDEAPLPQVSSVPTITTTQPSSNNSACVFGTDYNGDGIKNAFDVAYCQKNGPGDVTDETPSGDEECSRTQDYDGNGVVNSFDMVKCLQNSGQ